MKPLWERQHYLMKSFYFECKCSACVNNYPTFVNEFTNSLDRLPPQLVFLMNEIYDDVVFNAQTLKNVIKFKDMIIKYLIKHSAKYPFGCDLENFVDLQQSLIEMYRILLHRKPMDMIFNADFYENGKNLPAFFKK